ncbi:hypothetical protein E3N88_22688 [Mikania micrantha]|uniref:Uncharacterized protein n=1 Tax=Mikania micrantha TaxID=192012 RepID=A0A5N6NCT7_9ASTR|nr:hypothetical protein E3N88_22688 [Mikania micrantha]
MFPTITHMKNLKNLSIETCPNILEFPKIHANMESLVELNIQRTGIEVLPSSIGEHCTNLISLKLNSLDNLKSINVNFDSLTHLKELQLYGLIRHVKTRCPLFHQSLRSLQKLGLYAGLFDKVEIPSSIIELSNLQELVLSCNDFSRLGFSLSHLTQLKFLNVSGCKKLLELPELPSSLTFLIVDGCKSLATFGDCHKNCRWLCHVSIWGGSIIKDGDRLLESMLEACMAIENHSMFLRLKGIQIAKRFTSDLVRENRCRLQLPENWCNEFSGFLMCGVVFYDSMRISVRISKDEEINGMDSEDDVFNWEDTDNEYKYGSWMAYVSFGMLRHTAWWDQTCKALTFQTRGRGFGVRLIDKKSTSAPTEMSTSFNSDILVEISKNEEMNGMDSEDDVSNWEDTDTDTDNTENYNSSWMAYVSFGMLRQTAWWDQTCKALTFVTNERFKNASRGFGVRLIEKKSRSGLTETSTIYSSGHAPYLKIGHHSPSAINISALYYQLVQLHKNRMNYM